ncbi:MAG: PKD domain-containing protein [Candidatus Kariarchaeaceae archaeon]
MSSGQVNEDDVVTYTAGIIDGDSDKQDMNVIWEFGDGTMGSGHEVTHVYTDDGTYPITVTVIDNNGARANNTASVVVRNGKPVIERIYQLGGVFTEGQTVTSVALIDEDESDYLFLDYDWGIPGDGYEVSQPIYENGDVSLSLTVTDDAGENDTAVGEPFYVINDKPYTSLISVYSNYSLEFTMWGNISSTAVITLFKDGVGSFNFTLTNEDEYRNSTNILYTMDLHQPLDEYWDILINMNESAQPFDTYVGIDFIAPDGWNVDPFRTVNHCNSEDTGCITNSSRFPTTPIDRGMPATYEFSLFDPGNDDLEMYMDFAGITYSSSFLSPSYGPTTGTIQISGFLPLDKTVDQITYWVIDEDDASSSIHHIPFSNYLSVPRPAEFENRLTWEYWGNHVSHFAPITMFTFSNDFVTDQQNSFSSHSMHPNPNSLEYEWHFGTGNVSLLREPIYSFESRGHYLVWSVISDDYYEHVEYQFIDVEALIPEFTPFIKGNLIDGNELEFFASGLTHGTEKFYWDFGDGTFGFGERFKHAYTNSGNYTVRLTIIDRYNQIDYVDSFIGIYNSPTIIEGMTTSHEVLEGNNVILIPQVTTSPYNMMGLSFNWNINGDEHDSASLWYHTNIPTNLGILTITDRRGYSTTYDFTFNVTTVPRDITLPIRSYVYGDPNQEVTIVGSITTSVFERDLKLSDYSISYVLYDKDNSILDEGLGEFFANDYGFSMKVDTSAIGDDETFAELQNLLHTPEDLTLNELPSGEYRLKVNLLDNETVVTTTSSKLMITIDKDADFITDELEVLFDNALDDFSFSIKSTDTDENGICDPVEYVIGNDNDSDGIPLFVEEVYGTSDNNPDTDGDGLTDGFGIFGELQIGSNPNDEDTDNDGLDDGQEVRGWTIELISATGIQIKNVVSSPVSKDTDQDGVLDIFELEFRIDPSLADTDADGLDDLVEQEYGTSLLNADTDFDGVNDFDETQLAFNSTYIDPDGRKVTKMFYLNPLNNDSDADGLDDFVEIYQYGSSGTSKDTDTDGIEDRDEIDLGTDIIHADSDRDGLADGIEVTGFTIPIVLMSGGVYAEDGTVIEEPTVSNTTVTVSTNPLLPDTDGDGITDYDELMGDPADVSDPTNVDSDGDGIVDRLDSQKLVSDYTPALFVGNVTVKYIVRGSEELEETVRAFTATLTSVWTLIKNAVEWFFEDFLASLFWWKEVCFIGICAWWPILHSFSKIKRIARASIERFIESNRELVFQIGENWDNLVTSSIDLFNVGIEVVTFLGIPTGLNLVGGATINVVETQQRVTGFFNPQVEFDFTVEDEGGIDKVEMFQDGVPVMTKENIGSTSYNIKERFPLHKNGDMVQQTTIEFRIYDTAGNVRILQRTTTAREFELGLLEQGQRMWEELGEAIWRIVEDIWDWTLEAVTVISDAILSVVEVVVEFVAEVVGTVVGWLAEQFAAIFEAFIRDTTNFLARTGDYVSRADALVDNFSDLYSQSRSYLEDEINGFLTGPVFTTINDSVNEVSDAIDEHLPPSDLEEFKEKVKEIFGPIADVFIGVLKFAWDLLGGKVLEILERVVLEQLRSFYNTTVGQYISTLERLAVDFFSGMPLDIIDILPFSSSDDEDLIDMFFNILDFLRNPVAILADFISSFDADYILESVDKFLLDNEDVFFSFYDVIKAILRPGLILGLVVYDIGTMIQDIFSPSLVVYDVSSLNLGKTGATSRMAFLNPSIGLNAVNTNVTAEFICGVISFIGNILGLIADEVNRIIDMVDMQDGDRETGRIIVSSIIDFIILLISEVPGVVLTIYKGFTGDATTQDWVEFGVSLAFAIIDTIKLVAGIIIAVKMNTDPWIKYTNWVKDSWEKTVTWVMFAIDLVLNIISIVASIAIFATFAALDPSEVKWYDIVSFTLGLVGDVLFMVLDAVSAPSAGGTKLGHPIAYLIFGIWTIASLVVGFAAAIFDMVILSLQFAGVID